MEGRTKMSEDRRGFPIGGGKDRNSDGALQSEGSQGRGEEVLKPSKR